MTETPDSTTSPEAAGPSGSAKKRGGGLNSMLIADLKAMANGMGIAGVGAMKKAQLVEAIKSAQSGRSAKRPAGQSEAAPAGASGSAAPAGAGTPEPAGESTTARAPGTTSAVTTRPARGRSRKADPTPDPALDTASDAPAVAPAPERERTPEPDRTAPATGDAATPPAERPARRTRTNRGDQPAPADDAPAAEARDEQARETGRETGQETGQDAEPRRSRSRNRADQGAGSGDRPDATDRDDDRQDNAPSDRQQDRQQDRQADRQQDRQSDRQQDRQDRQADNRQQDNRQQDGQQDDDGEPRGRNRRRRGRDRDRPAAAANQGGNANQGNQNGGQGNQGNQGNQGGQGGNQGGQGNQRSSHRNEPDTTILEDDVLVPAAGILDVLDNYAFVRTSGYLPGTEDVYVSLSMVRKYGLRRGDAIVGQVRQPREGERKEKFNPMVRIESVNGSEPETAKSRVDFAKLTPVYPTERLRLETEPTNLIGRVIDIAAPIGKGQRGLIISPAKSGKTTVLQSIANSITTNNPECHLMVVLVDERPEEVTDFERSVKGEVISSTFDRPPADHTIVAELAIERAKRLVELGHDVVVLLDGITRLGRAYNLASPASGRILSGGVDSAALHPPKRFFGAARNIENGGSLTILATALVESGSRTDEVIFEEFTGTGNLEIRLRRDFADKRVFPAIDAVQSGTRREELLMSKEELAIVWKLRRVLAGLEGQQALELLLGRLRKAQTNIEFLMQVQKSNPEPGADD